MSDSHTFQCKLAGRDFTIETGKFAWQASGAVTVRYGDTVLLVTATVADEPREGVDFLYEDLRTGYSKSREKSKELDLYRQKYCGCLYSEWERYAKIKI